ncbi:MAG: hypothetical protein AB2693_23415 [Candidatus Thiodiazotropha sp.]
MQLSNPNITTTVHEFIKPSTTNVGILLNTYGIVGGKMKYFLLGVPISSAGHVLNCSAVLVLDILKVI